jgi:hypothetical protein
MTTCWLASAVGPEPARSIDASSFGLCIAKKMVYVESSIGFAVRASTIRVKRNKHGAEK